MLTLIALGVRLIPRGEPMPAMFSADACALRIGQGALIGATAAVAALVVVARWKTLAHFRTLLYHAIDGWEPGGLDIAMVAGIAGVSEELLFRGVLQPRIGIWAASLAFVIVHGVVKIRSRGRLMFAVFLFSASMGMGFLSRAIGLEGAMGAHAMYDLTVLAALRYAWKRGVWTV